jgi:hypothetical protein
MLHHQRFVRCRRTVPCDVAAVHPATAVHSTSDDALDVVVHKHDALGQMGCFSLVPAFLAGAFSCWLTFIRFPFYSLSLLVPDRRRLLEIRVIRQRAHVGGAVPVDESAVLCVRCMKAIPLKVECWSSSGRTLDFESGYGRSNRSPAASSLTIEIPSSSNGRTLRSERGNRGSSPREGAGAIVYRQDG